MSDDSSDGWNAGRRRMVPDTLLGSSELKSSVNHVRFPFRPVASSSSPWRRVLRPTGYMAFLVAVAACGGGEDTRDNPDVHLTLQDTTPQTPAAEITDDFVAAPGRFVPPSLGDTASTEVQQKRDRWLAEADRRHEVRTRHSRTVFADSVSKAMIGWHARALGVNNTTLQVTSAATDEAFYYDVKRLLEFPARDAGFRRLTTIDGNRKSRSTEFLLPQVDTPAPPLRSADSAPRLTITMFDHARPVTDVVRKGDRAYFTVTYADSSRTRMYAVCSRAAYDGVEFEEDERQDGPPLHFAASDSVLVRVLCG